MKKTSHGEVWKWQYYIVSFNRDVWKIILYKIKHYIDAVPSVWVSERLTQEPE